jgi:hypothetical protein
MKQAIDVRIGMLRQEVGPVNGGVSSSPRALGPPASAAARATALRGRSRHH